MKRLLAASIVLIALTAPCHADFRQALDAYKHGDHETAYETFMTLAKMGDPRSRLMLGVMYGEGRGVERSDFLAHVWFILASHSARYGKLHELAEKYRGAFSEDLTTVEMIEAGRLAREWTAKWRRELFGGRRHADRPGL